MVVMCRFIKDVQKPKEAFRSRRRAGDDPTTVAKSILPLPLEGAEDDVADVAENWENTEDPNFVLDVIGSLVRGA